MLCTNIVKKHVQRNLTRQTHSHLSCRSCHEDPLGPLTQLKCTVAGIQESHCPPPPPHRRIYIQESQEVDEREGDREKRKTHTHTFTLVNLRAAHTYFKAKAIKHFFSLFQGMCSCVCVCMCSCVCVCDQVQPSSVNCIIMVFLFYCLKKRRSA